MEQDYIAVAQRESQDLAEEKPEYAQTKALQRSYHVLLPCLAHLLVLLVYSTLLFFLFRRSVKNQSYTAGLSTWSPASSAVEYEMVTIDGIINKDNEYRGIPTPEIDAAWRKISQGAPGVRLFEEELHRLNRSTDIKQYHKLPENLGGGYMATLEVFHLLHCVDSLRIASYSEYYQELLSKTPPLQLRIHTDHCIDILRRHLMCAADITPIVFYDNPHLSFPLPDFSTQHVCRNFDRILDWAYSNERKLEWDEILVDT